MASATNDTSGHPVDGLRVRREGPIGIIAFDNPDRGYLTPSMLKALDRVTGEWEADAELRVVVLTGAQPGTFITHFDPAELKAMSDVVRDLKTDAQVAAARRNARRALRLLQLASRWPRFYRALNRRLSNGPLSGLCDVINNQRMLARWQRSATIYIAAINGYAMGGGLELVLACDFRFMSRGEHLVGLPECVAGITPGMGGSQRLARLIGPHRAAAMLLRGELLDADAAERLGLVDAALDPEALEEHALATARKLAAQPPLAQLGVKRAIHEGIDLGMDAATDLESDLFMQAIISRDATAIAGDFMQRLEADARSADIFAKYGEGHDLPFTGR